MGATKRFIREKVGADCKNHLADVKAVQQLLIAAGECIKGGDTGKWDENTAAALKSFQISIRGRYPHLAPTIPIRSYVEPNDYVLLMLAWEGQMLIPLPYERGWRGVKELHEWFVKNQVKYNKGADKGGGNRAIYGVDKRCDYAIQTTNTNFSAGRFKWIVQRTSI
jgi:hypothetical protein